MKWTQAGKHNKVKALQWLLTHSFCGKALAVKRVTENKGKNTPGCRQGHLENTEGKDQRDRVVEETGVFGSSASEGIDSEEKRQDKTSWHTRDALQGDASVASACIGTCRRNHC